MPIASIWELNQVPSSQCSVQGKDCSSVPVRWYQKQGRRRALLGVGWASGALVQPGLFALVTLLSFPPCALEPVLRSGSRLEGHWSHCNSAFEEWKVEPEPCPISKHQADESRSPAVHCYPHFSMLCSWEARCTDWIPLGSSGGLGFLTEDALCATISYVP